MDPCHRRTQEEEKYAYIIQSRRFVPVVYLFGLLAWIGVIIGSISFFQLNTWYWITCAPILILFSGYHLLTYGIALFYKPFDLNSHNQHVFTYWQQHPTLPSVDIFVPVCGEDIYILEETFSAIKDIEYPNKQIYILDDGDNPEVKHVANRLGLTYLQRPNKGHLKKAGNLRHGYEQSHGDFFVIFDADFAPHKDFLNELLPYTDNPNVAIIQSPQHFRANDHIHNRSAIEYGAGQLQEDFYRFIQVARNRFNGAICVGSSAIYRRSAVESIGGIPAVEHSEDLHTGFDLVAKGYRIEYVPLVLATGLCPQNMQAYFHQQNRWCSGSMELLFSKKFYQAKLTFVQRLCYWSGILYYIPHALILPMIFQLFTLLFFYSNTLSWTQALPFFPHLFFTFILLPLIRTTPPRLGTFIACATHPYSYLHAVVASIGNNSLHWLPTNAKSTFVSYAYIINTVGAGLYLLIYVAVISYAIATNHFPIDKLSSLVVLFWIFYFFATNGLYLHSCFNTLDHFYSEIEPIKTHLIWRYGSKAGYSFVLVGILWIGLASTTNPTANVPIVFASEEERANAVYHAYDRVLTLTEYDRLSHNEQSNLEKTQRDAVKYGASITRVYRKAISTRCLETGTYLTNGQRLYIEARLAQTDGRDLVYEGDTAIVSKTEIDRLSATVKSLSDDLQKNLEAIASAVTFDDACNQ